MIISETQHKLATWAESDLNRRFDRLLRLIADREWLAEAARIVLASSGARTPGIDGMDKQRMQDGLDHHLADLRTNLLKGTYRPKPVKRIYIPKGRWFMERRWCMDLDLSGRRSLKRQTMPWLPCGGRISACAGKHAVEDGTGDG
ncbi:hypothetical protein NKI21_32010, partial [Mesorhizobium sp. M0715]